MSYRYNRRSYSNRRSKKQYRQWIGFSFSAGAGAFTQEAIELPTVKSEYMGVAFIGLELDLSAFFLALDDSLEITLTRDSRSDHGGLDQPHTLWKAKLKADDFGVAGGAIQLVDEILRVKFSPSMLAIGSNIYLQVTNTNAVTVKGRLLFRYENVSDKDVIDSVITGV